MAHRKNLRVETLAHVTELVRTGTRFTGVKYQRYGRKNEQVSAGEIILASGAFGSPQILQLAGIGDPKRLEKAGVKAVVDLPGVGSNMQDHLEVYLQHASKEPVSIQPWLNYALAPLIGAQWLFGHTGVGTSSHFEAGGFIRTNEEVAWPNEMFHFLPIAVRYDGQKADAKHGFQVHIGPMYSDVRGTLDIKSKDPYQHPALRFNYLSTENDRREWVECVRSARNILNQQAFDSFTDGEISPGPDTETDEEILEWVRNDAETALHPSCTAKMGTDDMSVVDPNSMKVHGTEGLRVVDASVFPYVTNGNIYAPTMMVAERAADLIAGNQMLAPLTEVPWYKAKEGMPLFPEGDPRNNAWDAQTEIPSGETAKVRKK